MLLRQRGKENKESTTVLLEDQCKQLQEKYNQFEHDQQNWSETIKKTIQEQFMKSIQEQKILQLTLHKSFQDQCNKHQSELLEKTLHDISEQKLSLPRWDELKKQLTESIQEQVLRIIQDMEKEQQSTIQHILHQNDEFTKQIHQFTSEMDTIKKQNNDLTQQLEQVQMEKNKVYFENTTLKETITHTITELERLKCNLLVVLPMNISIHKKSCCSRCVIS
jgi:hypothetical protein